MRFRCSHRERHLPKHWLLVAHFPYYMASCYVVRVIVSLTHIAVWLTDMLRIRLMIFTIPWTFRHIGWHVWKALQQYNATQSLENLDPVNTFISTLRACSSCCYFIELFALPFSQGTGGKVRRKCPYEDYWAYLRVRSSTGLKPACDDYHRVIFASIHQT